MVKKEGLSPELDKNINSLSFALVDYNDLFSDFDLRPYNERSLSVDFIDELKRASRDKPEKGLHLRLLVPRDKRNVQDEFAIKSRLREHFNRHYNSLVNETSKVKRLGIFLTVLGAFFIVGAGLLYPYLDSAKFFTRLLFLLLEPAGWFLGWTGLDQLFYTAKNEKHNLEFYKKMSLSNISILSY